MSGGMLHHLGQACRDARRTSGLRQIDIATTAQTTHATISRFEQGIKWPINVDAVVGAYAIELDVASIDLWAEAMRRWQTFR